MKDKVYVKTYTDKELVVNALLGHPNIKERCHCGGIGKFYRYDDRKVSFNIPLLMCCKCGYIFHASSRHWIAKK